MLDRIIECLKQNADISDWKIIQKRTEANELFLIKKQIDMPRKKVVNKISLTVYKDFEEEGRKFRGSSTVNIHPTMTDREISDGIREAVFAASFVKNPYYPLPTASEARPRQLQSRFDTAPLEEWMTPLKEALYRADTCENGYINSTEIFLNKNSNTIVNSRGIYADFTEYEGYIEFITSWKEAGEEIELYKEITFADFCPDALTESAREMLEMSRQKAMAEPTPSLGSFAVILRGEPVAELLKHYYTQSNAQSIYQQVSTAKPQSSMQGGNIAGDKITMTLDPDLSNSPASSAVDSDGIPVSAQQIIKDGILQKYWGTQQYCYYLGVEPTGRISNFVIEAGSKTLDEMRTAPHLEIAAFSDFGLNTMTGDFAGEIRLGWYYDGIRRIAVSGGSISGNIYKVHADMYLSKELQQCTAKDVFQTLCYKGPKALLMQNVSVAGN